MIATQEKQLFRFAVTQKNLDKILRAAKHAGWRFIGEGQYSEVYAKGQKVMKLFKDKAYSRFVESVINSENPSFPDIYEYIIGDDISAVFMEKLDEIEPENEREILDALRWYAQDREWQGFDTTIRNNNIILDNMNQDGLDALELICDIAKKFDYIVDLHEGNVMIRPSTGEIVLSDPVEENQKTSG